MPLKGHAYPIDSDWRDRVAARILEMKISQNELARRAKISKASLSEALDSGSVQTTVIELAALDRDSYREVRADAWKRVADSHEPHTPEQRAAWIAEAS